MKTFFKNFTESLIVVGGARRGIFMLGGFYFMAIMINSISFVNAMDSANATDANTTHIVEIREFEFVPANIEVKLGDTIKWINIDAVPHTATASDKSWDSGLLSNNSEWVMTVTKDSESNYICTYHPMMKGSISLID